MPPDRTGGGPHLGVLQPRVRGSGPRRDDPDGYGPPHQGTNREEPTGRVSEALLPTRGWTDPGTWGRLLSPTKIPSGRGAPSRDSLYRTYPGVRRRHVPPPWWSSNHTTRPFRVSPSLALFHGQVYRGKCGQCGPSSPTGLRDRVSETEDVSTNGGGGREQGWRESGSPERDGSLPWRVNDHNCPPDPRPTGGHVRAKSAPNGDFEGRGDAEGGWRVMRQDSVHVRLSVSLISRGVLRFLFGSTGCTVGVGVLGTTPTTPAVGTVRSDVGDSRVWRVSPRDSLPLPVFQPPHGASSTVHPRFPEGRTKRGPR